MVDLDRTTSQGHMLTTSFIKQHLRQIVNKLTKKTLANDSLRHTYEKKRATTTHKTKNPTP